MLRDAHGAEISRYPIALDTLYAGTSTFVEVPFAGRLNLGDYTVALALADGKQHAQANAQSTSLSVPPPETDSVPAAIGVVPQPAAINQSPGALVGPEQLSRVLAGGSAASRRERRRRHAPHLACVSQCGHGKKTSLLSGVAGEDESR